MNANPAPARAPRKRKRSAESLSEDSEDGSKRRGRPRTEKPDESTADVSPSRHLLLLAFRSSQQRTARLTSLSAPEDTDPLGSKSLPTEKGDYLGRLTKACLRSHFHHRVHEQDVRGLSGSLDLDWLD